ncbi:dopamine D2-like receptor [Arapaima gigas]
MTNFSFKWTHENKSKVEFYLDFVFSIANCTVLTFTLLIGTTANLFVIWAVHHQRSLQTSNNVLLVSLAVIDLFRSAVDCPLLLVIVMQLPGHSDLGAPFCCMQTVSFSFSCCVQLITLATISAERYHAIAHPFENSHRRQRVMILIAVTWVVSILLSVFSVTMFKDTPVYIECRGMLMDVLPAYNSFGLYILVPLWSGCLGFITVSYWRIFIVVRSHSKKVRDEGGLTVNNTNNDGNDVKEQHKEEMKGEVTEENLLRTGDEPGIYMNGAAMGTLSSSVTAAKSHKTHVPLKPQVLPDDPVSADLEDIKKECKSETHPTKNFTLQVISLHTGEAGNEHVSFFINQDRFKHKDSKLAKRSGYIILTFLIFWTPLILSMFINFPVDSHTTLAMPLVLQLHILSFSVACMTSASNPVIYAAVNPHFRSEFQNVKAKWKAVLCYNSQSTCFHL